MKKNTSWECIYKTSNLFEAEAVKGNLESAEIPCVIMNKQDSSYLAFGYIEIHVPCNLKDSAIIILNNNIHQN